MNLLLDTHILIWSLLEPERLHSRVRDAIEAPLTQIWLSPITSWECLLLVEKGRLELPPNPISWLKEASRITASRQAPLNNEVAITSRVVQLPHQDPADRFLAATAVVYNLTLATADERILSGSGFSVLSNQ